MIKSSALGTVPAASLVAAHGQAVAQTLHDPYEDLKAASFVTIVRFTHLTYAIHRSATFGADGDQDLDVLRHLVDESVVAKAALRASGFRVNDVAALGSRAGRVFLYVDDLPLP